MTSDFLPSKNLKLRYRLIKIAIIMFTVYETDSKPWLLNQVIHFFLHSGDGISNFYPYPPFFFVAFVVCFAFKMALSGELADLILFCRSKKTRYLSPH